MSLDKNIIYVTGMPRSGSTLLCQMLSMHSLIGSSGHSSPLCQVMNQLRQQLSSNEFLLSQLDCDFEQGYRRLLGLYRGMLNGWFSDSEQSTVVDKNRGWLMQIETIAKLDPDFKMLVCVREPGQIYGSIEAQHQKTLLLDFPDNLAALSRHARADKLFASDGVIGAPLKAIEAIQDIPEALQTRLFFVVFEHLMQDTESLMQEIYDWLKLPANPIDPDQLAVKPHESDSYYRFKYPHKTRSSITPPPRHTIPPRIEKDIQNHFEDFYRLFYPGRLLKD